MSDKQTEQVQSESRESLGASGKMISPSANSPLGNISPLKRKPTEKAESDQVTTLTASTESKRRRHHRRKKRHYRLVGGPPCGGVCIGPCDDCSVPTGTKEAPAIQNGTGAAMPKSQNEKPKHVAIKPAAKPSRPAKPSNNGSNHTAWKKKRRFPNGANRHGSNFGQAHHASGPVCGTCGAARDNASCKLQRQKGPKGQKGQNGQKVVLRPTKVPLLNAPRNSTQFIIDDHGTSDICWNFQPKSYDDETVDNSTNEVGSSNGEQSINGHDQLSAEITSELEARADAEDEEYSERDFQAVYESAHQEEVSHWDKDRLINEIEILETRHRELCKVLVKVDPELYLQRLQRDLERLTEQNSRLRAATANNDIGNERDFVPEVVEPAEQDNDNAQDVGVVDGSGAVAAVDIELATSSADEQPATSTADRELTYNGHSTTGGDEPDSTNLDHSS